MKHETYKVRYTPLAYEDLEETDAYITETLCNPEAALTLLNKIEKSISRLRLYPYVGSEVSDAYLGARGYRKLIVENYLVFYLIDEDEKAVVIMRILYGSREYRNLL